METDAERILHHWRDAVPNDRMAHLVKDTTRALVRALQSRLAAHGVSFGHWTFLRILWEHDGLTQRECPRSGLPGSLGKALGRGKTGRLW